MLAADFQLEGFEPADWVRLLQLPSSASDSLEKPPGCGLIAVLQAGRLTQLWRTGHGALPIQDVDWPMSLEELALKNGASWAASVGVGAFSELSERFASRLSQADNLQDQWARFLRALQELVNENQIAIWPRYLFNSPALVAENLMRSSFELLCPPRKCLVLGVFDAGALYAALSVKRGANDIEKIVGPQTLALQMGKLSGDWLRDYPHLIHAAESECGPVAAGCFTELATLKRLLLSKTPGTLSRAVAARDVVLHPIGPAAAVSLGVDVSRAALAGIQSMTKLVGDSAFSLHPAIERMRGAARIDGAIEDWLKRDPLSVIARLFGDTKKNGDG